MALITCSECGREISDTAAACPGCGAPMEVAARKQPQPAAPPAGGAPIPAAWQSPPPQPSVATPGPAPKRLRTGVIAGVVVIGVLALRGCIWLADRNPSSTASAKANAAKVDDNGTPKTQADAARMTELVAGMDDARQSAAARLARAKMLVGDFPGTPAATRAQQLIPQFEKAAADESVGQQWRYSDEDDAMSGKPTYSATVVSSNEINLDFPYQGSQHALLMLRRHPRFGADVMMSIEKGQIMCSTLSCPVIVRFDDGAPLRLEGSEPEDNSSELVFIPGFKTFADRLAKAKRVRIAVNAYQNGQIVADFDVSGFNPDKLGK